MIPAQARQMRAIRFLIVAFAATLAFASPALAQWPTACVDLNDIVEAHLGNEGNVGIYQRTFDAAAEAACQSDHRDDVRAVFTWAFDAESAGPIAPTPWPSTCVALNDIVEAHLGNTGNVQIYQRTFGPGPAAESACQRDHRQDVRGLFAWAFDGQPAAVARTQEVSGQQPATAGSLPIPTPCAGSFRFGQSTASYAQWSPDGAEILFSHDAEVYAAATDGSRLRHITNPGPDRRPRLIGSGESAFDVAPDGARVVYSTCEFGRLGTGSRSTGLDSQQDLVIESRHGADRQRLTSTASFESHPAWSPLGSRIAYVAIDPSTYAWERSARLHVIHADGANARILPDGFDFVAVQTPAWSPNGRWLAVVGVADQQVWAAANRMRSTLRGLGVIHLVSVDGGDFIRLSDAVSNASWSPDGTRLAFARADGQEVALYTIAADGSDRRRLTTIEDWQWHVPPRTEEPEPANAWIPTVAWSPDGSRILYACGGWVCVVSLDGSAVGRSPLSLGAKPMAATWSPDGSRIAVVRHELPNPNRPQQVTLYTIAPDGSDVRNLVRYDLVAPASRGYFRFLEGSGTPRGLYVRSSRPAAGTVDVAGCQTGVAVPDPGANLGLVADCEALLVIQATLAGQGLLGWTTTRPLAAWNGVELGGAPLRVHGLALHGRGLWSGLPAELGQLSELRTLDLRQNYLGGSIPPQFGQLTHLTGLHLHTNDLQGSIPPQLARLANLTVLDLNANLLTGSVPSELGDLSSLQALRLGDNQLTGEIPSELRNLASLRSLWLQGNRLAGPIPSWLLDLANLQGLGLGHNQLTGQIPTWLGQMTRLTSLSLGANQLTGPIPPELMHLADLRNLRLSGNRLTGAIPPGLGQLSLLSHLDLSGNRLTGPIPSGFRGLASLRYLDASSNELTGPIPPELGQLTSLTEFYLSANRLTGAIPAQLGNLTSLDQMDLSANHLTGTVPREFAQLVGIWRMDLRNNKLTGPIPPELARLRSDLASFHLADNPLTGCIPPTVRIADRDELSLPDCQQT